MLDATQAVGRARRLRTNKHKGIDLEIRFGLALDGAQSMLPVNRLGYACVGPQGLLSLLEIELGLARPPVPQGTRITQFGQCLKACDSEKRFYHRSFVDDPIGVARTLLEWRDEWHLAGWNGTFDEAAPERLKDLAAVELLAQGSLAPGIGERLARVSQALLVQRTQIKCIELADPLAAFPKRWRDVLSCLPTSVMEPVPFRAESNDLTRLQSALCAMNRGESVQPFAWTNDGSLIALDGSSLLTVAHLISGSIAVKPSQTLVVAEHESILLDETMVISGLPCAGVSESSALKPALQLLPLALELMWQPLDVNSLLEFLTHSMAPIDWLAARSLAQAVARTPGIGGGSWNRALNQAVMGHDAEITQRITAAVDFWLKHERHDRDQGLPLEQVRLRVDALAQHQGKTLARLTSSNESTESGGALIENVIASMGQCRAFLENLDLVASGGDTHLSMRKLQQLLDLATNDAPSFRRGAEVGHAVSISNPAAAIEPADTVIWWQMAASSLPRNYPWSRREMKALFAADVRLQPLAEQLQQLGAAWLRPLLAAQSRLILVLPPAGDEIHPAWQTIQRLAGGIAPESCDRFLSRQKLGCRLDIKHRALPKLRRWWQLPEGISIPSRATESFSSLSVQVENPCKWVLSYAAKLQPPEILTLADGPTLSGKLLHRLFEDYFTGEEWLNRDEDQTDRWFAERFERLVDEEGLILRLPGRQADLAYLRDKARIALKEMVAHLRCAGVVRVESELEVKGGYCGGDILGFADMVVHNTTGERAVVDLKWSNYNNKYDDLLANNRHVQLALYSKLLANPPAALPVAYYILNKAQLLAQAKDYFPNARTVPNKTDENATQLWRRFEQSWKWRRSQFNQGLIEVVTELTEADANSVPPEDGLPAVKASDRYNDYVRLAGWRDNA